VLRGFLHIFHETAVEVKASQMVNNKHLKGLKLLSKEIPFKHKIVVSLDPNPRLVDDITILPYKEFLIQLWGTVF